MNLFQVLAVAEATKIKDCVKRVNQSDYEFFIKNNIFVPCRIYDEAKQAIINKTPYLYVVINSFGSIEFVSESYEEAIRYALTNFIHSINFQEK